MQPEYADDPGGSGGGGLYIPPMTQCVKRLMIINAVVFFVQLVAGALGLRDGFIKAFALNPADWNSLLSPVWQLVTYGFLHDPNNALHLMWNMLMLYMFGTWLEGVVGARRFLVFYLIATVIGGAAQLGVSVVMLQVSASTGWGAPMLGASGAVLGVTIAMATLEPARRIIFFIIPMSLKTLAFLVVGKDVVGLLMDMSQPGGGVAHIVHLGGALTGFLAIRTGLIWKDPVQRLTARVDARQADQEIDMRKKLDLLLEKINREGIASLSSSEKKFLKRASKR